MRPSTVACHALACVATALAAAIPAFAQSSLTTEVDTTSVTLGDRVTLTVTAEHAPSSSVAWPDSLDLTPFEVLEARALPAAQNGGVTRSTLALTLAAFALGELEVPSFDVGVTAEDGTVEALTTNPVGIEVVSVGVDESGDIRDIRGPLEIPLGALRLALGVLLPLILAGLLWVLARRLRPQQEDAKPTPGPPPRPPQEVALEALAALEGARMLERGQVKEYHIEASDILRTYAGARFGVDALELTTYEVLAALEAAGADARFREGLGAFLSQCDLVKFAKVRPGADASKQLLDLGRRVVLDSVPAPPPGPAPSAPTTGGEGPGRASTDRGSDTEAA
ncbi:MAG: protein BatD [Gemmatimonadetes bacterium]|nr:protein BatD [Gemmatimonadota bacterium]